MRWVNTMLAAVLAVTLAGPAMAGSWEDAGAAYSRQDYVTALRLWKLFADQGNAPAQFNLGIMYDNGQGIPKDDAQAVKWYRLAADQGNAMAQNSLGVMYAKGQGVPKDDAQAVKWYRLAADQGNAMAQNNLGAKYLNGQGAPRDYVLAYMWFNLAAAGGDQNAPKNRDLLAAGMTAADISEAQRLSREWKPK